MGNSTPVTMPLVPVPIHQVLTAHPNITAKRCAELLHRSPRTIAARLGKLADYGVIHRVAVSTSRATVYRLKDDANA